MTNKRGLLMWVAHLKRAIKEKKFSTRGMEDLEYTIVDTCSRIHDGYYGGKNGGQDKC